MNELDPAPRTQFDWGIYADATFAGLSVLIPVPLVDLFFEWLFKRRMPKSIARRNGRDIPFVAIRELNRGRYGCWPGCLVWPILLALEFLKRLYRTVLYFLTIKVATDQLSYYWHRAFLIDYMIQRGDLDDLASAQMAAEALHDVLNSINTSPLLSLARQVINSASHIRRTIWGWIRRQQEDEVVTGTREQMAHAWNDYEGYLREIAARYDETFAAIAGRQT